MKKCKTPSYIAEYELKPAKTGGFAVLHHAENAAVSVYNLCLKEAQTADFWGDVDGNQWNRAGGKLVPQRRQFGTKKIENSAIIRG